MNDECTGEFSVTGEGKVLLVSECCENSVTGEGHECYW